MYKGRVGIWISVLICSFLTSFLITNVPKWFHTDKLTLSINCEKDSALGDTIAKEKINSFSFVTTANGGDVIIADAEITTIEGYEKVISMHSPLVLYFNSYIDEHNEGVVGVVNDVVYKMDLKLILLAMEKGEEWSSLGINEKVVSGKVNLCIPNESCGYYNDIADLFYVTLNNGQPLNEEIKKELTPRVVTLLAKCEKVADIKQAIVDDCNKKDNSNRVYIGPEYLAIRNGSCFANRSNRNSGLSYSYYPVYMNHHIFVKANMFVKTGESGLSDDIINTLKDKFNAKKDFVTKTGWRIENEIFNIRDVKSFLLANPY